MNGGIWTDISNTSATYNATPVSAGTWEYRAVVHTTSDITSAPTTIVVDETTVGGSVSGGTTICAGNTSGVLTLSGHTGTILKWQSSVSPFTIWTDIANATTTYTSAALAETTQFRAVVQSGSCSVVSSAATTVSVDPVSVGGSITGAFTPIYLGQTINTLTVTGYVGTIVKWQERLGNGAWIDEPVTVNTYSDTPNAVGIWEYRAVIQSGSCSVSNSTSVFIDVLPSSAGAVTGGASPICLGTSTGTMTVAGFTGSVVKWQKHVDSGAWTDITPISAATTYSETPATAGVWEYRAIIHNAADQTSAPVTIIVNPVSVGGAVSGGSTICAGNVSGQLSLSGQVGTVIKWQSAVSPFTAWTDIANTSTTYTSGILSQTTQFRAVVQSGVCSTITSAAATVSVDPASVGGILSGGITPIYLGQSTGNITLSGQVGTVVKWQERVGNSAWTDVINTTNTYVDTEVLAGIWEYRAVVQSGSCLVANSASTFIDVQPSNAGAVTGGNTPICSGSSTGTMILAGHTGNIVKWQKHLVGGSWTDVANTTATYAEIPSSAGTWEYRAVVHNSTDMNSAPVTIVVDATTVGGTVTGGTNICSGTASGLLTLSGQTGNVVKWQSAVSPFSSWIDIANTSGTYTSGALTQTTSSGLWFRTEVAQPSTLQLQL